MKKAANIILLAAKVLNLYSHFAIDDAFERMAPTLVFFFMLVCRMVVDWQFVNSSQQVRIDSNIFFLQIQNYPDKNTNYNKCPHHRLSRRRFPRPEAMTS